MVTVPINPPQRAAKQPGAAGKQASHGARDA